MKALIIVFMVLLSSIALADEVTDAISPYTHPQPQQGVFSQPVYVPPVNPAPQPVYIVPQTYNGLGTQN